MPSEKQVGRPPGTIDKRQILSAVDAMVDKLKELRGKIEQALDEKKDK